MSALPYMPLYVADYLADTAHLTALGNGAYLMLIMNYWQRGKALPGNADQLARIARVTRDEWDVIAADLEEFFDVVDGQWVHHRIEAELAKVRARPDQKTWAEIRTKVFERDDYTCAYCGTRGGNLECDHIVPAKEGGAATLENLATACRQCNRSKGAKPLGEWVQ